LQVGFNRRFDANFARVRQSVASGEIGAPHLMHIVSRDPAPRRSATSASRRIFIDMTIHDFDMARFLIETKSKNLYGRRRHGYPRSVRPAISTPRWFSCASAMASSPPSTTAARLFMVMTSALRSWQRRKDRNWQLLSQSAVVSSGKTMYRDLPFNFFMERYTESYAAELRSFTQAVLENRQTEVTGIDGRIPVVMAIAARKSYDEHRPVRPEEVEA